MLTENQKEKLILIFKKRIMSDIFSVIMLVLMSICFFMIIFLIPVIIILALRINRINAIKFDDYEIIIDTVTKKYKNKKNYCLMIANKRSNISCDSTLWFNLKKGDNVYYIKIKNYAFAFAISE